MADQGGLQRRQGGFRSVDWRDIVKRKLISCSKFDHTAFSKSCHRVQNRISLVVILYKIRTSSKSEKVFVKRGLLVEKTDHFHRWCVPLPKGKSAKWARIRKLCFFLFQENIIPTYPRCWPRNQETENHDFSLLPRETFAWFPKFPKMGFVRLRKEQQRPLLFVTCFKFMVGKAMGKRDTGK